MSTARFLSLAGVAIGGYLFGSMGERRRVLAGNVPAIFPPRESHEIPAEPPDSASTAIHIVRFGFPGHDNVRSLDDYVLSYDRRNRTAHWVLEHLTKEKLKGMDRVNRELCLFIEDESIHPFFRARNEDFLKSGFDRGHLAAARNHHTSQKSCQQTFLLSNISPQVGAGFNRDAWNKLEKHVRYITKVVYKNVYVCTGPLYLPSKERDGNLYVKYRVIGTNHVAVPTHFFKIIVGETKEGYLDVESYVLPNAFIEDDVPLKSFQVPVESIERSAGLLFFDRIPRDRFRMINHRKSTWV